MKVLGIDPGIAITGMAVVEEKEGKFELLFAKAVETKAGLPADRRLQLIFEEVSDIVAVQKPDIAALEKLFFNTNAKTAFSVGQARGAIISALAHFALRIEEYTPLQVKTALTGYGRADKKQIQQMVKTILKLPEVLRPDDVADGAAIALTHLFSYKMERNFQF